MIRARRVLVCLVMLAVGGCAMPAGPEPAAPVAGTQNPVSIKSTPHEVTTRRFSARRPPPDMPHLKQGEAAVCLTDFRCAALVHARVVAASADGQRVALNVVGVELTVGLTSVLWLPDDATPRLSEHMAGHARIGDALYSRAWGVASSVARGRIGSRHLPAGADEPQLQAGVKQIGDAICLEYMQGVQGVADRIHARYSALTDMGRNGMPADVALRLAFEEAGVPFDPDVLFARTLVEIDEAG